MTNSTNTIDVIDARGRLLDWYDIACRTLPWRTTGGMPANVYHVWLSEIMLQQTTVVTVIPYFHKFINLWPELKDFANASLEQLRVAWQGLGYYTRVHNMHRCAIKIMQDYNGQFPHSSVELLKLPGIGPYTAAAIAAIVSNEPIVPVDGNVYRVMARLYNVKTPLPAAKAILNHYALGFAAPERAGDCAQALMELGALVCKPRQPACYQCPLQTDCWGYHGGQPEKLPFKTPKVKRPIKYTQAHFYFDSHQQAIAVRYRPEQGILAGMMEIPSTPWIIEPVAESLPHIRVRHIFTHLELNIDVTVVTPVINIPEGCRWIKLDQLHLYPLPSMTQKVIKAGLQQLDSNYLFKVTV